MGKASAEAAPGTVARWQAQPEESRGPTALLGCRMLDGGWIGAADAVAMGSSGTVASQVRDTLTSAGFRIEKRKRAGGGNGYEYRVKPGGPAARRSPVAAETAGTTHPQLGAVLTVRALALDEAGELVVQLSNGNGSGWTARLIGHVDPGAPEKASRPRIF